MHISDERRDPYTPHIDACYHVVRYIPEHHYTSSISTQRVFVHENDVLFTTLIQVIGKNAMSEDRYPRRMFTQVWDAELHRGRQRKVD